MAMIEDYIENAMVALLQATTSGITIVRGMGNEQPTLNLPALVVRSEFERETARHTVYRCRVILEYKSIPDENSVSSIDAAMAQVDAAITTQPSGAVLSGLPLTGISEFQWQDIMRTQQEVVTDRRTNIRELEVFLQLSAS